MGAPCGRAAERLSGSNVSYTSAVCRLPLHKHVSSLDPASASDSEPCNISAGLRHLSSAATASLPAMVAQQANGSNIDKTPEEPFPFQLTQFNSVNSADEGLHQVQKANACAATTMPLQRLARSTAAAVAAAASRAHEEEPVRHAASQYSCFFRLVNHTGAPAAQSRHAGRTARGGSRAAGNLQQREWDAQSRMILVVQANLAKRVHCGTKPCRRRPPPPGAMLLHITVGPTCMHHFCRPPPRISQLLHPTSGSKRCPTTTQF